MIGIVRFRIFPVATAATILLTFGVACQSPTPHSVASSELSPTFPATSTPTTSVETATDEPSSVAVQPTFTAAAKTSLPIEWPPPPGEQLVAFLKVAARELERPEVQGLSDPDVATRLEDLARAKGVKVTYLRWTEGPHRVWLGRGSPGGGFILWREGGSVQHQAWVDCGKSAPERFCQYLVNPVREVRIVEKDGALEMGLIPASLGSTGDAWFVLARLTSGRWQEVWSPGAAPKGTWSGSGGTVEFAGPGIDTLRLQGPIPRDVPASRVFFEFGVFLKRQYESEWQRQGDRYVRVSGRIVPTPMTALATFVDRLQQADRDGAARLAADAVVVDEALRLGLDVPADGGWLAWSPHQAEETGVARIRFYDNAKRERSFSATLALQNHEWLVKGIERAAPVPDPAGGPTATPRP